MQQTLAVALTGLQTDADRLDRIALNLANASTPGYRREVGALPRSSAMPFSAQVEAGHASGVPGASMAPGSAARFAPITVSDTRAGTLRSTGASLQVALTGSEFFEIATDSGPAYTRNGDFRLDTRGRLVTASGNAVMGRGGEIVLTTSNPKIDQAGVIREGSNVVGQLKLVTFAEPKSLRRLGDGLWAQGEGMTLSPDTTQSVRQGYLENSNVSALTEMSQLVETMRHFESLQRMTQAYDEMVGQAIRKLGEG
ncbi:flagellar hook-basal body protein [Cupriavidus sp. SW-Y-13]|uniref:flagellar hook-basal body protein n=1 Tax=Cupriavidus sp. SW-Y-13 TaxID=2653854 RepID=UPI001365FB61|nr:flagellar hook-basal body complex protein [Cupriavidus sp. SW-Y-13]